MRNTPAAAGTGGDGSGGYFAMDGVLGYALGGVGVCVLLSAIGFMVYRRRTPDTERLRRASSDHISLADDMEMQESTLALGSTGGGGLSGRGLETDPGGEYVPPVKTSSSSGSLFSRNRQDMDARTSLLDTDVDDVELQWGGQPSLGDIQSLPDAPDSAASTAL